MTDPGQRTREKNRGESPVASDPKSPIRLPFPETLSTPVGLGGRQIYRAAADFLNFTRGDDGASGRHQRQQHSDREERRCSARERPELA